MSYKVPYTQVSIFKILRNSNLSLYLYLKSEKNLLTFLCGQQLIIIVKNKGYINIKIRKKAKLLVIKVHRNVSTTKITKKKKMKMNYL